MSKIVNTFFTLPSAQTIGRFRIGLGIIALLHLAIPAPHLREYFSNDGYISAPAAYLLKSPYRWSLLYHIGDYFWVTVFFGTVLLSTLCLTFGILPQVASGFCYIGILSFLNRFPQISYGGFIFLNYALLLAVLAPLGRTYCPKWCDKKRWNEIPFPPVVQAWGLRMIQLEVCTIYFFAGLNKIQNPHWITGDQLLYTLNLFGAHWDFTWLQNWPIVVKVMTIGTVVLELLFPIFIWIPRIKYYWIAGIILMHIGIALSMNVTFFGETMVGLVGVFIS